MTVHFANRTPETCAGMLRSMQNALGCLDTIDAGITFEQGESFSLTGAWNLGAKVWTSLSTPYGDQWFPIGQPNVIGYFNRAAWNGPDGAGVRDNYFLGTDYVADAHNQFILEGEGTWALGTGGMLYTGAAPLPENPNAWAGGIGMNMLRVVYANKGAARLPAGTTIANAWVKVQMPNTFWHHRDVYTDCVYHTPYMAFSRGWDLGDGTHSPSTEAASIAWLICGKRNDGAWVSLQSVEDVGGGSVGAGKTKIVNCVNLFNALNALRDSPYAEIGIYPCTVGGLTFSVEYFDPDNPAIFLLPAILSAYSRVTITGHNGTEGEGNPEWPDYYFPDWETDANQNIEHRWHANMEFSRFTMAENDFLGLSEMKIQLQLPATLCKTQRLPYGMGSIGLGAKS